MHEGWVLHNRASTGLGMNTVNNLRHAEGVGQAARIVPPASVDVAMPSTSRMNAAADRQNECFTMWEPLHLQQEWNISNISKALELAQPGICIRSNTFCDDAMPDITWQLCLYPGGKREENMGNVSLFLKMSTTLKKEFTVRAEYHFYFLNDAGAVCFRNVNVGDFKVKPEKGSHSWGLRNIPRSKILHAIRIDRSLHILCCIDLVPDFSKIQTQVRRERKLDNNQLTRDYFDRIHDMFKTGDGSDCVIECENQMFKAHKFVLMAHSPVFRAMFFHKNTRENIESLVKLSDTNPTAVHQMLTYMYSGSMPDNFEYDHAPALIEISEKYGLDALKVLCQDQLISRLDASTVCSMLVLADVHNASYLMSACIPIVRNHIHEVLSSSDWSELKNINPKLVNSILEKVVTLEIAPPPQKRIRLQEVFCRQ